MNLIDVADGINAIATGIDDCVLDCMDNYSQYIVALIQEQLYSGQDMNGNQLTPSYLEDSFFDTEDAGRWMGREWDYMVWKQKITPPVVSDILGLPMRSQETPNLYINGTFYSQIKGQRQGIVFHTYGNGSLASEIVSKYGDRILGMGDNAIANFNETKLRPELERFYKEKLKI